MAYFMVSRGGYVGQTGLKSERSGFNNALCGDLGYLERFRFQLREKEGSSFNLFLCYDIKTENGEKTTNSHA